MSEQNIHVSLSIGILNQICQPETWGHGGAAVSLPVTRSEALASSEYYASHATPAAIGGAFPALSAVPTISKNLVAYLACLIVVTPYFRGTANTRVAGLGETHADVVLQVLKLATDSAYTDFLKRKLVDWNQAAPKPDWHAPNQEERGEVVDGDGEGGEGSSSGGASECARCLIWINEPGHCSPILSQGGSQRACI